jgi:pilus assembly protein CpaE
MLAFVINEGQPDQRILLLEQILGKLGYVVSKKDTIESVLKDPEFKAHHNSILLIPATQPSNVTVAQLVDLAGLLKRHCFVIYVSDEVEPGDYKALVRTGAADCVSWDSAKAEIFEICQRRQTGGMDLAATGAKAGSPRTVISFQGTGGAGNTMMAVETGVYLASPKRAGARRVAIVDLDFQRSVMCDYLNLPSRLDIANFLRNPKRLDKTMLEIFTSKHQSGLDIFACDNHSLDYATIDGAAIFSLLDQLTDRYDTVLLDMPRCWTAWHDRVLSSSDFVFVTGRHSVPSVKQIACELRRLRKLELGPEHTAVIINRCQKSLFGSIVRKSDIDAVLAGQRIFYVQNDFSFALECANIGASLVETAHRRGICRDIKKVCEAARAIKSRVTS